MKKIKNNIIYFKKRQELPDTLSDALCDAILQTMNEDDREKFEKNLTLRKITTTNNIPTSPCPNCQKQCACGCKSCVKRHGRNKNTEVYDVENDLTICPFCKQASHPDAWLDAEVEEMKEKGTW